MKANKAIPSCYLVTIAVFLTSCGEPKLIQDQATDETQVESGQSSDSAAALPRKERDEIEAIRAGLAGQRFHSLTLAGHTYSTVQLHEITDQAICFAHAGGEEEISWADVDTIVKEKWGYDPVAFMRVASQQTAPPTPKPAQKTDASKSKAKEDYYAMRIEEEKRKKEIREQRETLYYQAKNLRAEVLEAESELQELRESKWELEDSFRKQDNKKEEIASSRYDDDSQNDRFGGVSTSKADRNKALEKWDEKIRVAEDKVDTLNLKLKETERRLSMLSRHED